MILIASQKAAGFVNNPNVLTVRNDEAFRQAVISHFPFIKAYIIEDDLGPFSQRGRSLYEWVLMYAEKNELDKDVIEFVEFI